MAERMMPGSPGGMMPPSSAGQPPVDMAMSQDSEEMQLLEMVIESIMDMWRRTGEIMGVPVPDEQTAMDMAHQAALEQLAQIRHAQGGAGQAQAEPPNPMVQALMGGM